MHKIHRCKDFQILFMNNYERARRHNTSVSAITVLLGHRYRWPSPIPLWNSWKFVKIMCASYIIIGNGHEISGILVLSSTMMIEPDLEWEGIESTYRIFLISIKLIIWYVKAWLLLAYTLPALGSSNLLQRVRTRYILLYPGGDSASHMLPVPRRINFLQDLN